DSIFLLTPFTTFWGESVPRDRKTTVANFNWAVNQIASLADSTDQVLIFWFGHGTNDTFWKINNYGKADTPPETDHDITASEFDSKLDTINCSEMIIIIESCYSGSLIDDLDDEQNRLIYTSSNYSPSYGWAEDDVLRGNNSQFILNSGENKTIELKIRPKHTSTHHLEIFLFYEDLVYYHGILEFHVAPQWLSPILLLPLLILTTILLLIVLGLGTVFLYMKHQVMLQKLFSEQQAQLLQLIDQLTISTLEKTAKKEINDSDTPDTRPLGFPQYLQLAEPLDRETLKQQFYTLKD
ncbi:MAG: C13 family peptidase, partial [Candidatus Hodarchaeota archaeon]